MLSKHSDYIMDHMLYQSHILCIFSIESVYVYHMSHIQQQLFPINIIFQIIFVMEMKYYYLGLCNVLLGVHIRGTRYNILK